MATEANYTTWPLLDDLFPVSFPGVKTSRDPDLVDYDRSELEKRMAAYFDSTNSPEDLHSICPLLVKDASRFDAKATRTSLLKIGLKQENLVRYDYRPFDRRWVYWEGKTKLLDEKRLEFFKQLNTPNFFLFTTGRTRKDQIEPAVVTTELTDLNFMDSGARAFPLFVRKAADDLFAADDGDDFDPNVSDTARAYLTSIKAEVDSLFMHSLAILHSKQYRTENFAGLKSNWPRVPLPADRERLLASAELGRQVAALLDPESKVEGVTSGKLSAALKLIGQPTKVGGGNFTDDDYAVTARWGIAGKGGITMPAKGRVLSRPFDAAEHTALLAHKHDAPASGRVPDTHEHSLARRASFETAFSILGDETCDIFLNDKAHWKNVPRPVWEYTLGGYQVLKKWLSYREQSLLGRPLTFEEVNHFRDVIRRITALLLLGPALDSNYAATKANTYVWSRS